MQVQEKRAGLDGSRCASCRIRGCPGQQGFVEPGEGGWRMGLAAFGLFLGPGLLGILGAAVVGGGEAMHFLGGLAGFVVGLGASVLIGRLAQGRRCGDEAP